MAVKILAADDSATMRKVLEMTFAGEAVEIETVDSGEAAVERASKTSPDLVIADASMTTDGYEVARTLKSSPATQGVAVIVLASQHHPYDAEKGRAAGVDDHVLKPFDTQAMLDKAKEVLSKPRARATGAPQPVAAAPARPAVAAPSPPSPPRLPTAPAARTPGVGRPAAPSPSPRSTVAFGAVQPPKPSAPGARPVLELADEEAAARAPTPAPAQPKPAAAAPRAAAAPAASPAVAAATASNGDMAARLAELGLSREQVEGVLGLSREVIERVVWEVVPDLAETIIREEIKRLTSE